MPTYNETKVMKVVCIVLAMLCVLAIIALVAVVEAGDKKECPGNSCEPLPTKAKACDGPAADHNPHCNPVEVKVTEEPEPEVKVTEVTEVKATSEPLYGDGPGFEVTVVPPTPTSLPPQPSPTASLPASQPSKPASCMADGSDEDCSACDLLLAALDQGDAIILVSLENLNPDIVDSVTGEDIGIIVMSDGGAQVGGELLATGVVNR